MTFIKEVLTHAIDTKLQQLSELFLMASSYVLDPQREMPYEMTSVVLVC